MLTINAAIVLILSAGQHLNCNATVASATSPGNSAASPEGRAAIAAAKAAAAKDQATAAANQKQPKH